MARKIEAFLQAICSCFFSPAAAPPAEARGDNLTKPDIQEAVAEFQSAPPAEARGNVKET